MASRVSSVRSSILNWLPGVEVATHYRRRWLGGDLAAGLALSALLVPQGMAYAELAGLPAVTGLYTTVLSLLAYALVGPSRILVLGPDSSLGPLIAATILPLVGAGGDPVKAVALAGVLALLMGAICIAAGVAKMGTVAELLSKPVRIGYLNGIGIVVVASQLPKLFGFSAEGTTVVGEFRSFLGNVADGATNGTALTIGVVSLALIVAVRWKRPRIPGVLLAVVGATLAVIWFDLADTGLSLVGSVPQGFPQPSLPSFSIDDVRRLFLAALGLAFVTLADTSALSRAFAEDAGDDVDPNQEIVALGVANVACGFFQGFPLSASSSRTAVAKTAGANTQLVGVVGAITIIVLLIGANDLTASMPTASLAAIVIAAGFTLFDIGQVVWLWKVRRSEFWLSTAAVLGVVFVGVLEGIVIAIVLSLAVFVRRAWRPHDAQLGRLGDRRGYHDLYRHPEASILPGLIIYRFDAPLFFANAEHFGRRLEQLLAEAESPVRWVVIAAEPITDIDTTGAEVLGEVIDELEQQGATLAFAELKGPVKDRLHSYGIYDKIGDDRMFATLGSAVDGYLAATGISWIDPVDGRRGPPPVEAASDPGAEDHQSSSQ